MIKKLLLLLPMLALLASTPSAALPTIKLDVHNTVAITTSISGASVDQAIQDLLDLNLKRGDKNYKIYIVMNSPGGSIFDGNRLIKFANTLENIHTICMFCASMAHHISQAINGKRFALPDNIMMSHRASGGFSGQFEDGELESFLYLVKKVVRAMEKINAERIGISLKEYKAKIVNEWWTYGKESKQQNIVDALVNIKCSNSLMIKQVPNMVETMFGSIQDGTKSACPLI